MRTLLVGAALAALIAVCSGCGGSSVNSEEAAATERRANLYEISQIERSFHEAISKKNIDQMVTLFAANATGTFAPGTTATGKDQIREWWLKSVAFQPETRWVSDHPAYKLTTTVAGDRGTLRFECHFIDVRTGKVAKITGGNLDVAKIDGRWQITNFVGSTTELKI